MREKGDREGRTGGLSKTQYTKGSENKKKKVEMCDGNYSQVCTRGKLYT